MVHTVSKHYLSLLITGADLGFYNGECPIILKGLKERRRSSAKGAEAGEVWGVFLLGNYWWAFSLSRSRRDDADGTTGWLRSGYDTAEGQVCWLSTDGLHSCC